MRTLLPFFIVLLSITSGYSRTITWTGDDSNDWTNSDNWDLKDIPQAGDTVIIANTQKNVSVVDQHFYDINSIQVINGSELYIEDNIELTFSGGAQRAFLIQNGSTVNNNGLIAIGINNTSYIGDGIFIDNATLKNENTIQISNLSSGNGGLGMAIRNNGLLDNGGDIEISSIQSLGIENLGQINNADKIRITDILYKVNGFYNQGTVQNSGTGDIILLNLRAPRALDNQGHFTNSGEVDIQNNEEGVGFFNNETVNNTGSIMINDIADEAGIDNEKTFNNSGQITIQNTHRQGVRNSAQGNFQNTGTASILIDQVEVFVDIAQSIIVEPSGILNEGVISFGSGNSLIIKRIHRFGGNVWGINNAGQFTSLAKTVIDSIDGRFPIGIYNEGTFQHSSDSLIVSRIFGLTAPRGIKNTSSFTNGIGSHLLIDSIEGTPLSASQDTAYAIHNVSQSTFTNQGKLEIKKVENIGILNESTFQNTDTVEIIGFGETGIITKSIFQNEVNGVITIDAKCGVFCSIVDAVINDGLLDNKGELHIEEFRDAYKGQRLLNSGTVEVQKGTITNKDIINNSGIIKVNDAVRYGISNMDSLVNTGTLYLDKNSIGNLPNATFINNGRCDIKNVPFWIALENDGTIINSDTICIDSISSQDGILNESGSSFQNTPSGVAILHNVTASSAEPFRNFGSLDNQGTIDIFKSASIALYNQGSINNAGLISFDSLTSTSSLGPSAISNIGPLNNSGTIDAKFGRIISLARLDNSGTINVDRHYGRAIDNSDSLFNANTGIINIGDQVGANSSNFGALHSSSTNDYIQNDNVINIGQVEERAISNKGTLINNRSIRINKAQIGIDNDHKLINNAAGTIRVDTLHQFQSWLIESTGSDTIFNHGLLQLDTSAHGGIKGDILINDGDIRFSHFNQYAIDVNHLENAVGSEIILRNGSSLPNSAMYIRSSLHNNGLIDISIVNNRAILASDIYNDATIQIDSSTGGFSVSGEVVNTANGIIKMDHSGGLSTSGKLTNHNSINLTNIHSLALHNRGTLINNQTINIKNAQSGIQTIDTLINASGATIRIDSTVQYALNNEFDDIGSFNYGLYLENQGIIKIDYVENGNALNNLRQINDIAYFHNHNSVDIDNCRGNDKSGIMNTGRFINHNGAHVDLRSMAGGISNEYKFRNDGTIDIDKATENGIYNTDSLTNAGTISLDSIGEEGILSRTTLNALVIFENTATGKLNLNRAHNGITLRGDDINSRVSKLTNHGNLSIENSYNRAIFIHTLGVFDNMDTLTIDFADTGIYNGNKFNNKTNGYLKISNINSSAAFPYGIYNVNEFTNENCAEIELESSIFNNGFSAQLTNDGVISQNTAHNNTFTVDITNNGIYSDYQSSTSSPNDIMGNGMYIRPILGSHKCNGTISDFYIGGGSNITGTVVFEDIQGNTSAGTANIAAKSISLNSTVENVDTLYGLFTIGGSCQVAVPLIFENAITCGACGQTNTWTGLASNDWHAAANWSLGTVPSVCDEVVIPNGANCTISNGNSAQCFLIEIAVGADFQVNGGLDVVGN